MSELYPNVPPQQRISPNPTTALDELDISEVAPDQQAMEYSQIRRDNATGSDAEFVATAIRAEQSAEGTA